MSKKITIEISDEMLDNLKKQKRQILVLSCSEYIPGSAMSELEGTLNFFDHIQDKAIDELGFDKNQVLDLCPNEDENPEGFKAHTEAFQKEVESLDELINIRVVSDNS